MEENTFDLEDDGEDLSNEDFLDDYEDDDFAAEEDSDDD